ncbi:dTDP-4-dehydrorhamnose reductase [Parasulfitobacter algicola]|uniref:dTDP-4-dehydrorhamnose reductase n=1 Tax=Parasulfitobacter algicola TaxID=2614809 RepID=A0ABX2IUL1_9RHOB|nr:dTDP-4-dehydrorhamnose reductase [Sulfitobacter algicola]NSX56584.1 dTDP-4-dehydrorhamnose reductase [Sulfitobacter algicola]
MILVFGKTGQVATELAKHSNVTALDRSQADLARPKDCARIIADLKPRGIINAAAYTAVDKAEDEEDLATRINSDAPATMAKVAAQLDIPFVHISTDYVFDGSGENPRHPDDRVNPLGAYGRSKRKGEQGIVAAGGQHAILRTSWVFSATGNNFVKTMLRLGATREELNIVSDQIGGPTPAVAIADACLTMIRSPGTPGIYHLSGSPDVSWADFARQIFKQGNIACKVHDIPSTQYPTPAKRPANSRLDCSTLEAEFGIKRPDWAAHLGPILTSLKEAEA